MLTSGGFHLRIDETPATFAIETVEWLEGMVQGAGDMTYDEPRFFAIHPTFGEARRNCREVISSVAEINALTSELDDRVIATLELILDRGIPGKLLGRQELLRRLESRVCGNDGGSACAFLLAAREIAGAESRPLADRSIVEKLEAAFRESPDAIPSIGIYSSSQELDRIFQQGRFLQQRLLATNPMVAALRHAVTADQQVERGYRVLNDLAASMASWFAVPDLVRASPGDAEVALFPASRSPEGDFVRSVWGQKRVPEDVAMLREFVAAVRSGRVSLVPEKRAGWYDLRAFAIEPLVREAAAPEAAKVRRGAEYAQRCEDTFVAMMTRLREAHPKQLEVPGAGSGWARHARPVIWIAPALRVEPQPTLYRRTADSYAWLLKRLGDLGGPLLLDSPLASPPNKPFIGRTIGSALVETESLYRSLETVSLSDIGGGSGREGAESRPVLDLGDFDPRVVVPHAYDIEKRLYRCAAIIGVRVVRGFVDYGEHPGVTLTRKNGTPAPIESVVLVWNDQPIALAIPVVEEVWLRKPLTREAFRKLCDAHRTHEKIREALQELR